MKKIKLSEIIIPNAFLQSKPSEKKVKKYRNKLDSLGKQPKYIVVNKNNVLLDGYIQYLLLKEKGIEEGKCIVRQTKKKEKTSYKNMETTYVYGVHPNSNCTKEFVWRVPNSWIGFEVGLCIGDSILCQTKFGIAPVIVTKIETLDKCPVDFDVKRIAKREIRRNGCVVEA